jgi:hypothetical protein
LNVRYNILIRIYQLLLCCFGAKNIDHIGKTKELQWNLYRHLDPWGACMRFRYKTDCSQPGDEPCISDVLKDMLLTVTSKLERFSILHLENVLEIPSSRSVIVYYRVMMVPPIQYVYQQPSKIGH